MLLASQSATALMGAEQPSEESLKRGTFKLRRHPSSAKPHDPYAYGTLAKHSDFGKSSSPTSLQQEASARCLSYFAVVPRNDSIYGFLKGGEVAWAVLQCHQSLPALYPTSMHSPVSAEDIVRNGISESDIRS